MIKNPKPLHPGQVLSEVYMSEMDLTQTALAEMCSCSHRKINEIVNGVLRLCRVIYCVKLSLFK